MLLHLVDVANGVAELDEILVVRWYDRWDNLARGLVIAISGVIDREEGVRRWVAVAIVDKPESLIISFRVGNIEVPVHGVLRSRR